MNERSAPDTADAAAAGEASAAEGWLRTSPGHLIPEIRAALDGLRPAERRVAEVVLADVDHAIHASITDLAARAGVSEPTVTRFCRAVGCEGLRRFKMRLAQSVAGGLNYTSASLTRDDSTSQLLDKVSSAAIEGLNHMRQLDTAQVEAALDALTAAHRIFFIGVGTGSATVAANAQLQFLRLGKSAHAFGDTHQQRLYCGLLQPGDALFAISNSGASVEIAQCLDIARERGATTLVLTNHHAPLASRADIALLLGLSSTIDSHTPGVSRLVHMCVLDALITGVALRIDRSQLDTMRQAKARLHHLVDTEFRHYSDSLRQRAPQS
ncbi:MurR/RpiR family transcriptional regulator [Amphibiibacter pelophylacis]|uniref:MurR/RpiR family transcriptional regulator n=1 Tax=Amphibiibacter pelophylacis TaxID=1799477 RepID=A0ACC6NZX6_9BURK